MKQIDDVSGHRVTRADVAWDDDGLVVIRRARMGRVGTSLLRLLRMDPEMTVRLDALGSEVWRNLDGRTVGEVLAALRATHDAPDLEARLGRYLGLLVGHRLAVLQQA